MDVASGYIVGWVISILPNADTIAEAFCHACVAKIGSIAAGLCSTVIVDCGRDYKSKLLEDPCSTYSIDNWTESFLNRRFSGLGILRALGCEIVHSIPYHPQSKSIERFFGTIERKYISKLPGWCHNSVSERPVGFSQTLNSLLENKELPTMEEFVTYFSETVLPGYHGSPDDPKDHPDLPGYLLAYESMSPSQRYMSMEKARQIIPDWKTMSILKQHYYPEQAKVTHRGVRFQNVLYRHDNLANITNEWVSILCHAFTPPYAPESITIIHQGEAICEAYPVKMNQYTGETPGTLGETMELQNKPAKEMKKAFSHLSRRAHEILPDNVIPSIPSSKDQLREFTYGQTPEEETASTETSTINEAVQSAAAASSAPKDYDKAYDLLFGTLH